jgi:hypothetical protein
MGALVAANGLRATRKDATRREKSTSSAHLTLQQGSITLVHCWCIVDALLGAILLDVGLCCSTLNRPRVDVEFRFDVGLHQFFSCSVLNVGPGGDGFHQNPALHGLVITKI